MVDEIDHKQVKDQVLKILYDNRDGRWSLNAHQIKKSIDLPLKEQQVGLYLLELIDEDLVRVEKGMPIKVPDAPSGTQKSPVETIPVPDRYYISKAGIDYIENGYAKPKKSSDIDRLIEITEESRELLKQILNQVQISAEDQRVQSQMLLELQKALSDNDESKANMIIKESLDIGKEVAIPLLVEYIKAFAKSAI